MSESIIVHIPAQPQARYIRLPRSGERCQVSGLSRSTLSALIKSGKIASKSVKSNPGQKKGIRCIDRESLLAWINSNGD